jgi:hypothetical protein
MPMTLPDLDDDCAGCSHPFGLHWITHNGTFQGCLTMPQTAETVVKGAKVTEHAGKCDCRGFSVGWTPEVTITLADPPLPGYTSSQPLAYESPPPTVEWERQ